MNQLLIIDANNLAFRVHWAHKGLTHNGTPVSLLYGFLRNLVGLKKTYSNHVFVVVWDGGYARRLEESQKAVDDGIIPSAYKQNRRDREITEDLQVMFDQIDELHCALDLVKVMQVQSKGNEADDVAYTYAKMAEDEGGEAVVVTSDKDYFQMLSDKITVFDAMKNKMWTRESFMEEYGIEPHLWVDVGALWGDAGDNIHGVEGIGETYALRYVKQYGDVDEVLTSLRQLTKRGKRDQKVIDSEKIVRLAKSLKKMDFVDGLPTPRIGARSASKLKDYMLDFGFVSLLKEVNRLSR